ncbi:MAG: DUF5131 family protein [Oscillospiraceae bacterium]|nr:DUF5131 family protein [Oscillospiraceae bacterium]
MGMWNPWRGCHKCSEGCKYCYIHKGDYKRGVDTDNIVKTEKFYAPIEKNKKGEYKMKSGQTVYVCFSSDFLLPDADVWRNECWQMIKERQDMNFLFLTKRIQRFMECIPEDWGEGYENVTVGCTVENQSMADLKLSVFDDLPIKHKDIILQPLIEGVDLKDHLKNIELVVVGGESDYNARPLNYDWVLAVRDKCREAGTHFEFRQCGTYTIKDGKKFTLNVRQLCSQAKKADINF